MDNKLLMHPFFWDQINRFSACGLFWGIQLLILMVNLIWSGMEEARLSNSRYQIKFYQIFDFRSNVFLLNSDQNQMNIKTKTGNPKKLDTQRFIKTTNMKEQLARSKSEKFPIYLFIQSQTNNWLSNITALLSKQIEKRFPSNNI